MTIKEVEKKTGLTAKSIRYYEEKKLIDIDRNQDNSYRTFTEEDIIRLKWIKIYRQLDFSIQEISELLKKDSDKSKKIIQNKIDEYEEKKNSCEYKKDLCTKLCEDNNLENADVEGYEAIINIYESAEWNEFVEEFDKKLMELGAEKISNDKNAKKSTLGDEYKKRCLDTIKNESK